MTHRVLKELKDTKRGGGFMHMAVSREYLLNYLAARPNEFNYIVTGAESLEEAQRFLAEGPPWHPLGDCPEFDHETGKCPGHKRP